MSKQGIVSGYKQIETSFFTALARRPASGFIEHATVRLLFVSLIFFTLAVILPGTLSKLCWIVAFVAPGLLILCLLILAWRWIMGHILWKVRNRLIVTCLLLALAPLILFGTLAFIASYIFAGQFGTSAARTGIDEDLVLAKDHVTNLAHIPLPILRDRIVGVPGERSVIDAWQDGKPLVPIAPHPQAASPDASPFTALEAPPAWLYPGFAGIVANEGKLYLCATGGNDDPKHPLLVLQSSPLTNERVSTFASGLGTLRLTPGFNMAADEDPKDDVDQEVSFKVSDDENEKAPVAKPRMAPQPGPQSETNPPASPPANKPAKKSRDFAFSDGEPARLAKNAGEIKPPHPKRHHRRNADDSITFIPLHGGNPPPSLGFFDTPIFSSTPLTVIDWKSGDNVSAWMMIHSRPSLLYKRLFISSLETAKFVRIALIAVAATFGVFELIALLLAIGLIRTITQSVHDLYGATRQIESGNLLHRIKVKRRDQLGALATSFNTMSGSLAELLEQQREKDRMQNELNIAHEVQNNLFPHSPFGLPGLELYGICNPARTIGGDYYDFIPMGNQQVYLALGDISGKGISAALLMSSLHSAVRVYLQGESHQSLSAVTAGDVPLPAPGKLLSLLNEHLFSNTTPEKYATLFVASYDSSTRRLTYSNGGHLPPLVLCTNGDVQRLEAGGSVVGLLGGMEYKEATVQLNAGDLLIAYSDGLTEPEQDGVEFGEERLIDVIRKNRHRPLPAIANYTVQCLKDWMGEGEQPDDITIVFARLT